MRWQNSGAEPVGKRGTRRVSRPCPGRRCWEAERICAPASKIRPRGDIPDGRCHEGGQPEMMVVTEITAESLQPEPTGQTQLRQRGLGEGHSQE